MGGGGTRTRSTTDSTQTTSNPGSSQVQSNIFPQVGNVLQGVNAIQPFHGDQEAAPGAAQQVAQWGAAPSVFVPQSNATSAALTGPRTFVPGHDQNTINAGVSAAQGSATAQAPIMGGSYDNMMEYINGGPRNSFLTNQENALQALNLQGQDANHSNIAQGFGSTGGVGSGNMAKALAFNDQANATSFNNTIAGLESNAQQQYNQMQQALPAWLQGMTGAAQAPVQAQGQWTDQAQSNAQDQAATADYNNQANLTNQWLNTQLQDTRANQSAQDAYNQWMAQYQQSQAQAGQANSNTAFNQQVQQTGLDNSYLDWLRQMETYNNQMGLYQQAAGIYNSTGQSTTTGHSTTNQTTQQDTSPWQVLGSLAGAGMQAFAPGGMFSGSLSALGGAKTLASGGATAFPGMTPAQTATGISPYPYVGVSDRRLKKHITALGNGWYHFNYLWEAPGSTQHIGVMADEVDPRFVTEGPGGYQMVNYSALMGA